MITILTKKNGTKKNGKINNFKKNLDSGNNDHKLKILYIYKNELNKYFE